MTTQTYEQAAARWERSSSKQREREVLAGPPHDPGRPPSPAPGIRLALLRPLQPAEPAELPHLQGG